MTFPFDSGFPQAPVGRGFLMGLLAGFAASSLIVGIVLGYAIGGGSIMKISGGTATTGTDSAPPAPPAVPTPPAKMPAAVTNRDHLRGKKDATITVIEYSDFECPFCKKHAPTVEQILSTYTDDVNFVYRHFPLSFHQNAQKLAEASECAAELGGNDAFWKFHDEIFTSNAPNAVQTTTERFAEVAGKIGVNAGKFQQCIDSGKFAQYIADQMQEGIDSGVQGTPGNFVINNDTKEVKDISGAVPFSTFQSTIDGLLGKK